MIKKKFKNFLIFLYHNHKSYHNTKLQKKKTFNYDLKIIDFKNLYLLKTAMK